MHVFGFALGGVGFRGRHAIEKIVRPGAGGGHDFAKRPEGNLLTVTSMTLVFQASVCLTACALCHIVLLRLLTRLCRDLQRAWPTSRLLVTCCTTCMEKAHQMDCWLFFCCGSTVSKRVGSHLTVPCREYLDTPPRGVLGSYEVVYLLAGCCLRS